MPLRKLAEFAAKNEAWDEAAMWMERFIATKPASLGHYWAMLGDYRLAGEHLDEAVQALETALHIDPYVYWAHYRMARVFEQRKDTENAIREYEFMIKYALDRDADIYVKLATLYKDAGRKRDHRRSTFADDGAEPIHLRRRSAAHLFELAGVHGRYPTPSAP